jgi:hypothetical protein
MVCCVFIVLHPCLCSHWFAVTADDTDAQEEAICTVEVIFKYVVETYLEIPTRLALTVPAKPPAKPIMKTPSFLTSACSFQRSTTMATATMILKLTPQEELANELRRYFNFEAAPMERHEGEEGSSGEPSAQEVLLNPLLWWKVSILFDTCALLTICHSDTCC